MSGFQIAIKFMLWHPGGEKNGKLPASSVVLQNLVFSSNLHANMCFSEFLNSSHGFSHVFNCFQWKRKVDVFTSSYPELKFPTLTLRRLQRGKIHIVIPMEANKKSCECTWQ